MKILLSVYACEPEESSEPGLGWNTARALANHHEVWALTRANNRPAIERQLASAPVPGLHFAYYDLPLWARWWKRGQRGIQLYYYLWQIGAYFTARRLHRKIGFDLAQHATFVRYWTPSFLALLGIPFVWGPVGGGESVPRVFCWNFGLRAVAYEWMRDVARWLGEHDPFVRLAARRSVLALAATPQTEERLQRLRVRHVRLYSHVGLPVPELAALARCALPDGRPVRFISVGNFFWWKGFHLGLRAFAEANLDEAEYWLVGDGTEWAQLHHLVENLGIASRVKFLGRLPRHEMWNTIAQCHVLVFPSLHDSGGIVCLEAMAAGRPVICLDLGGPATQVTEETGFKIPAHSPRQVVRDLADAMVRLARDPGLRGRMGEAGRRRSMQDYRWEDKARVFNALYCEGDRTGSRPA